MTSEAAKFKTYVLSANGVTYSANKPVGSGSFGIVVKATVTEIEEESKVEDINIGTVVAIKKVLQDKKYKNRELQIMRKLRHPNIVGLVNSFYTTGTGKDQVFLNLVLEYVPETVHHILRRYNKNREKIPMLIIKIYIYQLLRALAYIHSQGVCHRDIKPQNLLVDSNTAILKLCDFGSAKMLVPGEPNVSYICSRYYRAPELLFGATEYTNAIDCWSAGCVLAEFIISKPLFAGRKGVEQLFEIMKVLGTPTKDQILQMNPNYNQQPLPKIKSRPWRRVIKTTQPEPECLDLINKLLEYIPSKRITAQEALLHPFFNEIKQENILLPNGTDLPPLFNWTDDEEELRIDMMQQEED